MRHTPVVSTISRAIASAARRNNSARENGLHPTSQPGGIGTRGRRPPRWLESGCDSKGLGLSIAGSCWRAGCDCITGLTAGRNRSGMRSWRSSSAGWRSRRSAIWPGTCRWNALLPTVYHLIGCSGRSSTELKRNKNTAHDPIHSHNPSCQILGSFNARKMGLCHPS